MDQDKLTRMREMMQDIREEAEEFAKTPEARVLDTKMDVARNIIGLLKARKMSQAEFCRRIGMRETQFSRIIGAEENITLATVARIADGFGVANARLFRSLPKRTELAGTGKA